MTVRPAGLEVLWRPSGSGRWNGPDRTEARLDVSPSRAFRSRQGPSHVLRGRLKVRPRGASANRAGRAATATGETLLLVMFSGTPTARTGNRTPRPVAGGGGGLADCPSDVMRTRTGQGYTLPVPVFPGVQLDLQTQVLGNAGGTRVMWRTWSQAERPVELAADSASRVAPVSRPVPLDIPALKYSSQLPGRSETFLAPMPSGAACRDGRVLESELLQQP